MWDSVAEAERWWRQAENDLEFARLGLREEFYSQVCFLAPSTSLATPQLPEPGASPLSVLSRGFSTDS